MKLKMVFVVPANLIFWEIKVAAGFDASEIEKEYIMHCWSKVYHKKERKTIYSNSTSGFSLNEKNGWEKNVGNFIYKIYMKVPLLELEQRQWSSCTTCRDDHYSFCFCLLFPFSVALLAALEPLILLLIAVEVVCGRVHRLCWRFTRGRYIRRSPWDTTF